MHLMEYNSNKRRGHVNRSTFCILLVMQLFSFEENSMIPWGKLWWGDKTQIKNIVDLYITYYCRIKNKAIILLLMNATSDYTKEWQTGRFAFIKFELDHQWIFVTDEWLRHKSVVGFTPQCVVRAVTDTVHKLTTYWLDTYITVAVNSM